MKDTLLIWICLVVVLVGVGCYWRGYSSGISTMERHLVNRGAGEYYLDSQFGDIRFRMIADR